jgi:hypothetical protein
MNTNALIIKYDLKFFTFSQLATNLYLTEVEEYDITTLFVTIIDLYEDFLLSGFDSPDETYQESMMKYLANLIG